jgi:putative addiction module antidote
MAYTTKIRAIGNSQGVTLPRAILEKYHLKEGDTQTAIETQDGILLSAQNDTFDKAMEIYRKGAAKYRNAMRELAK